MLPAAVRFAEGFLEALSSSVRNRSGATVSVPPALPRPDDNLWVIPIGDTDRRLTWTRQFLNNLAFQRLQKQLAGIIHWRGYVFPAIGVR